MTELTIEHDAYRFAVAEHWLAGVTRGLEIGADGLTPHGSIAVTPVDAEREEAGEISVAPSGALYRLRDDALAILQRGEVIDLGHLNLEQAVATKLVSGAREHWVLGGSAAETTVLMSFTRSELFRTLRLVPNRLALDICADRAGGLWIALGGDETEAELVHIRPDGCVEKTIRLGFTLQAAALDSSCDGTRLYLLDPAPASDHCRDEPKWRVVAVNTGDNGGVRAVHEQPRQGSSDGVEPPRWLAVDRSTRRVLVANPSGAVWILDPETREPAARVEAVGQRPIEVTSAAGGNGFWLGTSRGVLRLDETNSAQPCPSDAPPAFITPLLVSPAATPSGWMRADIDAELRGDAVLEVSVASTDSEVIKDEYGRIRHGTDTTPHERYDAVEALLDWDTSNSTVFRADTLPPSGRARITLHHVTGRYLWLRVRVHASPGHAVPRVRSLRVLYPNRSYARHLPEMFRSEAADPLRRILVPIESVFGDLESEIASMPRFLDPSVAPPDWLPYLLGWLGLPAAPELGEDGQRELLHAAPDLLEWRGTRRGLEHLLHIICGDDEQPRFAVHDIATGPAPWTLPGCGFGVPAQLGRDSLVLRTERPAFRLGRARAGADPIGVGPPRNAELFARRTGQVEIRALASDRARIEPVLDRYLPHFIPAHCRVRLRWVSPRVVGGTPRLDRDLRLTASEPIRLGFDTIAGAKWSEHAGRGRRRLDGSFRLH